MLEVLMGSQGSFGIIFLLKFSTFEGACPNFTRVNIDCSFSFFQVFVFDWGNLYLMRCLDDCLSGWLTLDTVKMLFNSV